MADTYREPSKYQTKLNGKYIPVSSLTREEALQEICKLMDTIDDFARTAEKMSSEFKKLIDEYHDDG